MPNVKGVFFFAMKNCVFHFLPQNRFLVIKQSYFDNKWIDFDFLEIRLKIYRYWNKNLSESDMHNRIALLMYPLEKCHRWKSIFFRATFYDIFFARTFPIFFFRATFSDTFFSRTFTILFSRKLFRYFFSRELFRYFFLFERNFQYFLARNFSIFFRATFCCFSC